MTMNIQQAVYIQQIFSQQQPCCKNISTQLKTQKSIPALTSLSLSPMDNSSSELPWPTEPGRTVLCVCVLQLTGRKNCHFLSQLMKQKQTHSGTMLSASIQQANVINHEIQGQRALYPVLLPWQTLQKCHICTFPSFLWPHWLAVSQLQPLFFFKKREKHRQILLCTCTFTHIYVLFDLAHSSHSCSFCYTHTNNPDHFLIVIRTVLRE